jgi:hypothetical protein
MHSLIMPLMIHYVNPKTQEQMLRLQGNPVLYETAAMLECEISFQFIFQTRHWLEANQSGLGRPIGGYS